MTFAEGRSLEYNYPMDRIRQLHPTFALPPGLEGIENYDPDDGWVDEDVNAADDGSTEVISDEDQPLGEEDGPDDDLEPPTTMRIIRQILNEDENGHKVVDLIVDVEDIPGITKYDVRITKG